MIYNSIEYSHDFVISKIQNSPLGLLPFKENNTQQSALSTLCDELKYNEPQVIHSGDKKIEVYIVPVKYNLHNDDFNHRIDCCDFAINILYERWCKQNEKQIKKPYDSKTFMQYVEEIGLLSCDYAVILCQED